MLTQATALLLFARAAARAHAYDHFRNSFQAVDASMLRSCDALDAPHAVGSTPTLVGCRLDTSALPQATAYERAQLELWRIFRAPCDARKRRRRPTIAEHTP